MTFRNVFALTLGLVACSGLTASLAHAQQPVSRPIEINAYPMNDQLKSQIYSKPAQMQDISPEQVRGKTYFEPTSTIVTQKVNDLSTDLDTLQGKVAMLSANLNALQREGEGKAAEYYAPRRPARTGRPRTPRSGTRRRRPPRRTTGRRCRRGRRRPGRRSHDPSRTPPRGSCTRRRARTRPPGHTRATSHSDARAGRGSRRARRRTRRRRRIAPTTRARAGIPAVRHRSGWASGECRKPRRATARDPVGRERAGAPRRDDPNAAAARNQPVARRVHAPGCHAVHRPSRTGM